MTAKLPPARSRAANGVVSICIAGVFIPYAAIADWEATPDIRMVVETNDNPRLGQNEDIEADTSRSATRAEVDARFALRNSGPRGEVLIQPRFRADTHADDEEEDLERQDVYLNMLGQYRWPRSTAGMRIGFARESILSAEITDNAAGPPDLDPLDPLEPPTDTDTGLLVLLDEFRKRTSFNPYGEFTISERSAILVEARHLDLGYTGPEIRSRSDFTDTSFSVGIGRTIDDRTRASANVIASRFEADVTSNETDTVGVEGSFDRELNELWSLRLAMGLQRSEFSFIAEEDGERVDNAKTNYTLNLSFAKRTALSSMDISLLRFLNPNAVGFLVERNEVRFRVGRQMSQRLWLGFGLRALETGALDRPVEDRELIRADFDLEWRISEPWAVTVHYGAVDQQFSGDRIDGTANLFAVGLAFRGQQRPAAQRPR